MTGRQSFTNSESRTGERVRLYEVAKEVGLPNKELLAKVRSMGIEVKNHMSSMDLDDVQRIKRAIEKERVENREVKRISATVIRRRSKTVAPPAPTPVVARPAEPVRPISPPPVEDDRDADEDDDAMVPPEWREVDQQPAPDEPAAQAAPAVDEQPDVDEEPPAATEPPVAEPVAQAAEAVVATPEPATEGVAPAEAKPSEPAAPETTAEASTPEAEAKPAEPEKPEINLDDLPINSPLRRKAELQKREIRFAPGFKPQAPRTARPPMQSTTASEAQPLSAADALKMLAPAAPRRKPQVVITDLDRRKAGPAARRDVRGGPRRKKRQAAGRKGKKTEITTPAEHKRVIRMEATISVTDIARQLGAKAPQVLRKLWAMGLTNIMITHSIDADTASLLAAEFGFEVEDIAFKEADVLHEVEDAPEDLVWRAPVITVMGHVDHGKTSLLDAIRGSRVASGEAGGITQHIGAYRVETPKGVVVFLDTPGHAAFTQMRARGAQCTDIVVLVVAADDGVMPQTAEAIDHSRDAGVPIVVAMNKIDRPNANPERVLGELAERGLVAESWGGETIVVPTSAITREGVDNLLDSLLLTAELLELQSNPDKPARGTVVEARMDRSRGATCTVLVQEGTLKVGDTVVVGEHLGKVRAMLDDRGDPIEEAGPSTPVELLGLGGVPAAGDSLNAVEDDKAARTLAEHRHNLTRKRELASVSAKTVEEILSGLQSGDLHELKLLVKADVQGSSEAIREALLKLTTKKVEVNVISTGVGGIHETDVNLAKAAGAVILGFNVRTAGKGSVLAEREGVEIRTYDVIYELLDEVKSLMRGLLPKERSERLIGRAEVRQTFVIPKIGMVAGCAVLDGKINRNAHLRLIRDSVKIFDGKVSSLRRFKDDVKEVQQGYECGIGIDGYNQLQAQDVIEAYEIDELMPEL